MEDSYVLQLLKPKFKDFHLCFCGFAECKPLHSYGPAARPNYILHYVMKGKGIYQVGETKYQLKEGQAFLIEPVMEAFTKETVIAVNLAFVDKGLVELAGQPMAAQKGSPHCTQRSAWDAAWTEEKKR